MRPWREDRATDCNDDKVGEGDVEACEWRTGEDDDMKGFASKHWECSRWSDARVNGDWLLALRKRLRQSPSAATAALSSPSGKYPSKLYYLQYYFLYTNNTFLILN